MSVLGEMDSTLLRLKITSEVTKLHIYKVLEKENVRKRCSFKVNNWGRPPINPKLGDI